MSDPLKDSIWEQPAIGLYEARAVPAGPRVSARKLRPEERNLATRPHTRLKLDGLGVYLPRWFGIMSTKAKDAFFLDLLAGPGSYPDGMATANGSPVIACAAAIAAQAKATRRGSIFGAHLRFVEQNTETARRLRETLVQFDGLVDYRVINGDALAELPALLAESRGTPTLAFVDPDGFTPITWAMIASFAKRPSITELLLSIDAQALLRSQSRRQTRALNAFSGGDWWQAHAANGQLDVNAYLRDFSRRLHDLFPYAGVHHLEFLEVHAFRAIIQVCGSQLGRDRELGRLGFVPPEPGRRHESRLRHVEEAALLRPPGVEPVRELPVAAGPGFRRPVTPTTMGRSPNRRRTSGWIEFCAARPASVKVYGRPLALGPLGPARLPEDGRGGRKAGCRGTSARRAITSTPRTG